MNVGVLALQGSVAEHLKMIKSVNKKIVATPVRTIDELAAVDGLIIPGGESTTLRRLMDDFNLYTPIKERIVAGMPVWGTCAGLILLADRVEGETPYFSVLDVDVKRNAYGRQIDSFVAEGDFDGMYIGMVFIRAPQITRVATESRRLPSMTASPSRCGRITCLPRRFTPK